ncbi:hypothetical protein FRB94_006212 [Tulasnella sp. JGI-2019a]|nr:hypothetical protein FRB94_006212 [Tulasnella sp. JGI-2019a]KAG9028561.1 hypothetical protein FRB95_006342 [Tulasnella sp. JGI-2019a]
MLSNSSVLTFLFIQHKPGTSTTTGGGASHLADHLLAGPSELDTLSYFYTSQLGVLQTEVPYGGFHFDETFLAISSPNSTPPPRAINNSPSACSLRCSIPHPTRIFNCVPKYPPTPSVYQPNLWNNLLKLETPRLEDEISKVRSTPSALYPLNHPSSPSPEIWNRRQPSTYDVWSSLQLAGNSPPRVQTPPIDEITHAPTLHFSRATWWDYLTSTYTSYPTGTCSSASISRRDATLEISKDVYQFFKSAPLWLSFINVSLFFDNFHHTELRSATQPSLILGILAYSKLLQSDGDTKTKDPEAQARSWRQSVVLRDLAQASFEASYNAGWMDLPLAQAAWILVLYEISAHPNCTSYRTQSVMTLLDNVIRALGLTSIDATDPRANMFVHGIVPTLKRPPQNGARHQAAALVYNPIMDHPQTPPSISPSFNTTSKYQAPTLPTMFNNLQSPIDQPHLRPDHESENVSSCPCEYLSLARNPDVLRCTPTWGSIPRWAPNATWAEIRKEEGRRLVWSALVMLGQDAAVRQASGMPQLDLYVSKPENIALLFSGEDNYTSLPDVDTTYSGKESHWALWSRTMLLWFACIRRASRGYLNTPLPVVSDSPPLINEGGSADADFSMQTWIETVAIENALDSHSCASEQAVMYQVCSALRSQHRE